MLSYDEALARVLDAVSGPLETAYEAITEPANLVGRALAADAIAGNDLPAFDNSAIDGYAVHLADTATASPERPTVLRVTQTIAAGSAPKNRVVPGEAARIFTGAPIPPEADGLVMVEDTEPGEGDTVRLLEPARAGLIRRAGSDVRTGTCVLSRGDTLDAGAIGLLASLNVARVPVARRPRVWIQPTGDELIPTGDAPLLPGQIRDSNGPALTAAAVAAGALTQTHTALRDDEAEVSAWFERWRDDAPADVVLVSGGVSMGDYDFVRKAAESVGHLDFWRVAIKPGKPLAFGRLGSALFFGLPGNPVSSLVTFELFVRPVLCKLAGHRIVHRPTVTATLAAGLPHHEGRREFARAALAWEDGGYRAYPLGAQGSHRLTSVAGADALLVLHEDHGDYRGGDIVPAMLLTGWS